MRINRSLALGLLVRLMKPLVQFCLRHSLRLQDLIECAKVAFVESSRAEVKGPSDKPNASKISLMTGVHRRDVVRIVNRREDFSYSKDLITKIIGHWQTDRRFMTKDGRPKVLSVSGEGSEFFTLVHSISKDVNPATVLFELERINAISKARGGIRLTVESHVPAGAEDGFELLSRDSADLIRTVENNVLESPDVPHFHARTEFDNIRPDSIAEIKRWLVREGHLFHGRLREYLGRFDQDINPKQKFEGKGRRVVASGFSFIDEDAD
ncbi:MAG: hypothetical protein DCC75_01025 [Proteobacteria bacterium]|nr:MAG: hypothetical protein DCC75_01025 [Pseudomonadota bacterium]